jgi:hypothetical protein
MPQFAFAGGQPLTDFPQRLGACHLAEHPRHKLAPTREASGVAFGLMLLDRGLKLGAREQLEQLREYAAYSIHGGSSLERDLIRGGIQIPL